MICFQLLEIGTHDLIRKAVWNQSLQSHRTPIWEYSLKVNQQLSHSVNPSFFLLGLGWTSYQIFKKGGLDRFSIFRGGLLGKSWRPFLGGLLFLHKKNKPKSEIFNVCRFKRRFGKKEGVLFLRRGSYLNVSHYVCFMFKYEKIYIYRCLIYINIDTLYIYKCISTTHRVLKSHRSKMGIIYM